MAEKEDEKKIIIDEDWKEQARKEKEKLAEKEKAEQAEAEKEQMNLPPASFAGLVSMLATQTLFAMGAIRTEEDKDKPPNLELAKYNIDMLEVIEQKAKGNLTDEETKMLTDTLHQLRMTYVKLSE